MNYYIIFKTSHITILGILFLTQGLLSRKNSLHPDSVGSHCILDPRNKTRNSDETRLWWLGTVQSPRGDSILNKSVLLLADQTFSNFSLGRKREYKVTPLLMGTLGKQTAKYWQE